MASARLSTAAGVPLGVALLAAWTLAAAGAALDLNVEAVEGLGWSARGVRLRLEYSPDGSLSAALTARNLDLPEPVGRLERPYARCGRLRIGVRLVRCESLLLEPRDDRLPLDRLVGRLVLDRDSGAIEGELAGDDGGGGRLSLRLASADTGWRVELRAQGWRFEAPAPWLDPDEPPTVSAVLDAGVRAHGRGERLDGAVFEGALAELAGANDSGTLAAEGVVAEFAGSAARRTGDLRFETTLRVSAGEAYAEPVYLDFGARPARMRLRGAADGDAWALQAAAIEVDGLLSASGEARLVRQGAQWQIPHGELTLAGLRLPAAWEGLVQPFLAGTPFAEVESEGSVSGRLRIAEGSPAELSLRLDDVSLEARDGGLALYDVDGRLAWRGAGGAAPDEPVELSWSGGYLYGIPLGPAALRFELGRGEWALAGPARIPVLDGALEIEELAFGDFTPGNARVAFDARLAPIELRGLTRALGWPSFSGTLAGELPSLRYRDGELTLGGELVARVFDGELRIAGLTVTDLLAPSARCTADVEIHGLDLEQVTDAFSFGLITGRLDGFVQGLELYGWSPVAFDARLFTPPDDRSRHRISQRAVDNIASLGGGGGAAALSQGFLRFFEDFRYDRMALGCRLEDEVCHMSGLQPTESGYLILRGSGLPRIDVIGYAEAVSWPTLVEQLRTVIESEGPVVE